MEIVTYSIAHFAQFLLKVKAAESRHPNVEY
jgi:hypothetical protein